MRYVYLCLLINDVIEFILSQKEKTALHIASKHGHLKVASVLIAAKAVINLQDKVL